MPGSKFAFGFAVLVPPLVAATHADDALAVEEKLLPGESGQNVDSRRFGESGHPRRDLVQARDVVAVVLQDGGLDGETEGRSLRQEVEGIVADGRLEGTSRGEKAGQEILESPRIDHGARDRVRADIGGLLEKDDRRVRERRVRCRLQLAEPQGAGQPRRTAADDQEIDFHRLALWIAQGLSP